MVDVNFSEVLSRLQQLTEAENDSKLARALGMSPQALHNRKQTQSIPYDQLVSFAFENSLDLNWILFGQGGHTYSKSESSRAFEDEDSGHAYSKTAESADLAEEVSGVNRPLIIPDDQKTETFSARYKGEDEDFVLIPRYDIEVSAGYGRINYEEAPLGHMAFRQEWLQRIRVNQDHLCVFTARGDSMEPTLNDGDIVLVDTRRVDQIRDSGIYVIGYGTDDGLRLKRLQRQKDGIMIISDNSIYSREVLTRAEMPNLRIVGRAVWAGRML